MTASTLAPAAQIVADLSSLAARMQAALRAVDDISFRIARLEAYRAAEIDLSAYSQADIAFADYGAFWAVLTERQGLVI